jgi:protocatechuate 3,4-dioxygenase beta subunit
MPAILPRRLLLRATPFLAAPALLIRPAAAQVPATPAQMEGPYYPRAIPADADADLLRVAGQARTALGRPLLLTGLVRSSDGAALPGAQVEIWQADHAGIYLHPRDARIAERDPGFQGYGRAVADGAGRYAFRTIRPGLYPGRTAHIHLRARPADGPALTTQVYFPDEARNDGDMLLRRVTGAQRALLIASVTPMDGGQRAEFDVILG